MNQSWKGGLRPLWEGLDMLSVFDLKDHGKPLEFTEPERDKLEFQENCSGTCVEDGLERGKT